MRHKTIDDLINGTIAEIIEHKRCTRQIDAAAGAIRLRALQDAKRVMEGSLARDTATGLGHS